MASILTTIGILEEPLGNARLHGARLVAALLHTNTPSINQELCRLNIMDLLLVSGGLGLPLGHLENGFSGDKTSVGLYFHTGESVAAGLGESRGAC